MLDAETKKKLREMGCTDLLDAIEAQDSDPAYMAMSFAERISIAVDSAYSVFIDDK